MKRLFTRCLLVTLMMIAGFTTAVAQKSVLDESFASGSLPTGWTAGDYWSFSDGNAKFFAPFENGADTLVTPLLSLSDLGNKPSVAITYSLAANGDKVNELKVLYRASEQAEWSEWIKFAEATAGQKSVKDVLPEGLSNVQIAIAGAYNLGGESRVYRLAVENKTEAADAPTGLKCEDLTTSSVTLYWDACASPMFQQYNLKVSTSQMTDMSATADVLNLVNVAFGDDFYELDGLKANTDYWLYVQYDCGDGDVSPWAEFHFKTPCAAIKAPFAENFEGELSGCYTIIKGGASAEVSGEYAYNSQKAFKSYSVKGKHNYFILPEFNGEVKNYQVAFMAAAADAGNTYARTVTVGVCTEATAESFTEVKTLDLPKGRVWEQIVVTLKGYSGAGKYIAFRFGNEDKENRLYIDNIEIETASECPKPMFVVAYEINPNSAKLKWVETGNASEWNLVLSTKFLTDPEDIEPDEAKGEYAGSISSNPYVANGLNANTTYYAYLQAGCGSSEWTSAIEFKTSRAVTYPYSEHFDRMEPDMYTNNTAAIPNGWVFDDRGNNPSYASYYDKQYTSDTYRPYVTTAQNHEQTAYVNASLFLRGASGTSATSTNYTSIAMLPAMPKAVNTMMVTFWAKAANGNQTLKVGVANTQTNDLPQGQQLGANIIEVGEATIIKDEWKQYKVLLTSYTGEGRYIALYMKPGTSTPNVYIDDIVVDDAPDCNAVSTLSATATGIDKATAEWTDASSSTSWVIKVSSTEIDPSSANGDIVAAQTVNAKSYDITGLSMGQTYYIYVSPTCGDAWVSTTVTTLVGLQVPYYNDFTDETTGANANRGPKNWKLGYTYTDSPGATSTNWPYIYNTAYAAANNPPADATKPYLYIYTGGTSASSQFPYAIMPELLNADVKDLKVSFYGYYNSTTTTANYAAKAGGPFGQLHIGVVNSPSDINKANVFTKVTHVATVRCAKGQTVQPFVVDMSSYTGNGKYIVFYSDTAKYNYFGIDNLSITLASAPQKVTDVTASEMTQTTAKLTWTENGQATKWEVRVFDEPQDDPVEGNPVFAEYVETTAEDIINSLKPSTKYYAYVRSVQGQEVGAWGSTSFRTECGVSAVPFTEDWEGYAASAGSLAETCYEQTNGAQVAGSGSPNATVKTGQVIKFNATSTNKEPMVVFPALDKPIKTLQLTMAASPYTSSYVGDASYTEIGVLEGDLDGEHTFVKIAEYRFNISDVKAWDECFVNFGTYEGEGGRIAIRSIYQNSKTTHICFDNVVIEQIPLCGRITSIDVAEIDSVSATISWAKGKTENAWNLKISTTELEDPATATADVFDAKVTEQTKAISGLEGNTTYYVYVQSVDEDLACEGQWSNAKTFKTTCKKQTFPYEEDFESYETSSGKDLGCNTICGPDANHSYVTTKNSTKMLYLRQATKGNHNYFVFPALAVDSVKRLQLSMQVYSGGTTATTKYAFEVGIMTDPNDPSTFVATHKDTVMGSSTAYDRSYTFENYAGDESGENFGTFIALKAMEYTSANGSTSAGYVYVDNVYIDFIETCPAATDLKTDSIGIYGAKFSWLTDDKTVPHRVRIFVDPSIKPNNEGWVAESVVSDTNKVIIEGLQAHTKYYAYVRKECAANDMSKWSSAWAFITECPEVRAIPYEENFDGDTEPAADYCWASFMIQGPAGCTTDYNSKMSTSAKKDGTRGLYLQYTEVPSQAGGSCVGTHRSAAITPVLDVENLKDLLIYFDVKRSGSVNAGLKIEAVSDETVSADAIYITTINDITADWSKAYIKLGDYYTSVQPYKRLRFSTTTASGIYIDNLVITNDLNVVLPVENLKLLMLTENSIKFSFVEYTPGINQWQVAYVAAGGDIADATIKTIDETEYTLENLAANASYDIYVRGNAEGSEWVGPLTATTIQAPAPLPLITGFEDEADNAMWNMYNLYGDGIHTYPNFWIVGKADSCAGTGYNALFITNDSSSYKAFDKNDGHNMDPIKYAYQGSNIVATSYVWATRNIKVDAAGTYKFSFKYKVPKCYSSDGLYAQLIPAGATYKAGNATLLSGATRSGSATTNANGCYAVMGKQNEVADWTWFKQSLDIEEPGIYTLALYWYNPSAGEPYATPAAIDSVIVEEYLCTTPKNIEFAKRGANEVTFQWFGGKCKNFEYVLSRYANLGNPALIDAEDKVAYGTLTEGPQVTISNLAPQTNYSFYVRTICQDGLTDWVEYDFNTPCELYELPYTEGFFETPECWILSGAAVGTTQVGSSASNEKWARLLLNATSGYAILPELAVDLKNVEVEIGLFNTTTNYGAVSLGVMDNTWDLDSYKELAFFQTQTKPGSTGTYTPTQLEVFNKMLNLYKGTGKVLAIKNAAAYAIGVKYVKLTELPDCVKPQQVELTFMTENAVTVNWIAGAEEAWEIHINDSIIENVTTNPYRIEGLEQGTTYTVAVRALCDAEHTSEWSLASTFQTSCGVNALPMFEDFSSLTASNSRATMTCWSNMATDQPIEKVFDGTVSPYEPASSVYYTYMWIANYLSQFGDDHQLLFFGSTLLNSGPKYRWMITPQYTIEGNASLSFDVCHQDNKNMMAKPEGRFFVAISTDNGATWKKADATEITGIDSVYTTKSVSLDKYAGQNIRVAFYMENLGGETRTKGSGLFTLIDNVRMNCSDEYPMTDNACEGYDYEDNGFFIKAEELPLAGKDSIYYRFAANENGGCDSTIALTLTTRQKPQIDTIYASICEGEVYEFGGQNLTKPSPQGQPYYISGQTQYGCDSTIYLYLTVTEADTTEMSAVKVSTSDLPKPVDAYYTVPADAPVGTFEQYVKGDNCQFYHYTVTVEQCTNEYAYNDSICASDMGNGYAGYGFTIAEAEMPQAGESKNYIRSNMDEQRCDSLITFTLKVILNDTLTIDTTVFNNELPFVVDEHYTIPADVNVGVQEPVIIALSENECKYIRYNVTVKRCTREAEYSASICEDETSYADYGFNLANDQLPIVGGFGVYKNIVRTADECDSTTMLTLYRIPNDTTNIPVQILNTQLPYTVDDYYTVPDEETIIGTQFEEVVKIGDNGCSYNRYKVTVNRCFVSGNYSADICEDEDGYAGYGFNIAKNDLPAPGKSKSYTLPYTVRTAEGCDSTTILTITVHKADTMDIEVAVTNAELPYIVDAYYTVSENTEVGADFYETVKAGDCLYNRYHVTVSRCIKNKEERIEAIICEDETSYVSEGFNILASDLPKPGSYKEYSNTVRTAQDCDSTTILRLYVTKADTVEVQVAILNTQLPYQVDAYYNVPENTAVNADFYETKKVGDCQFNRYHVTVAQCEEPYNYSVTVCEDADAYDGYGFNIVKADMPAPLASKQYMRHAMNEFGCDSVITLTLTAHNDTADIHVTKRQIDLPYTVDEYYTIPANAEIGSQFEEVMQTGACSYNRYIVMVTACSGADTYYEFICSDATEYSGHGFDIAAADLPKPETSKQYYRLEDNGATCNTITLVLYVNKADTVDVPVAITNAELPYIVDAYYTVPENTEVGADYYEIVKLGDNCKYNRYHVTVSRCIKDKEEKIVEYICEDATSFNEYNFNILASDLPAPGSYKEYSHTDRTAQDCDSTTTLRLYVRNAYIREIPVAILNTQLPYEVDAYYTVPANTAVGADFYEKVEVGDCQFNRYHVTIEQATKAYSFADVICEDADSYAGYGFSIVKANLPAAGSSKQYNRNAMDEFGCDSIITFTLNVLANDTTDFANEIYNNELPYVVDAYYTVPENAAIGEQEPVVIGLDNCKYNRYFITIKQCTTDTMKLEDNICAGADGYNVDGFDIKAEELPAPKETKLFMRHETTVQGCDSVITLSLTVVKNDTVNRSLITVKASQLPYDVDMFYTVPQDAQIGSQFEAIAKAGDDNCSYNRYFILVKDDGTGLIEITDAIDRIEVYDILGHKIQTLRQGDEYMQLPIGVYMLHTIMKSGQVVNRKVTLR